MPFLNTVVFLLKNNPEISFPRHGWVPFQKSNLERLWRPPASVGFTGMLLGWFPGVLRALQPLPNTLSIEKFWAQSRDCPWSLPLMVGVEPPQIRLEFSRNTLALVSAAFQLGNRKALEKLCQRSSVTLWRRFLGWLFSCLCFNNSPISGPFRWRGLDCFAKLF